MTETDLRLTALNLARATVAPGSTSGYVIQVAKDYLAFLTNEETTEELTNA